jgi:anti-anti-sigma regulatory factor
MTVPRATLRVRRDLRSVTFQVEGIARMADGVVLRRAGEQALAEGAETLRVDLRRCDYMDSTFVGTLLVLKRDLDRRGWGRYALVSPSLPCSQLLRQMGIDCVCTVLEEDAPPTDGWIDLSGEAPEIQTCKGDVLQAHQELAGLEGPAAERFREVLRCLRGDSSRS